MKKLMKINTYFLRHLTRKNSTNNVGLAQLRNFSRLPIIQGNSAINTNDPDMIFKSLKNGSNVAIQGVANTPSPLIEEFCKYVHTRNFKDINIFSLLPLGNAPFLDEPYASHLKTSFFFLGANARKSVNRGQADYIPMMLNDVPRFYRSGHINLDMVLINVSAENTAGFCSMGPSVESVLAAVEVANCVVAQLNTCTPFTYGDSLIHCSRINYLVPHEMNMHLTKPTEPSSEERTIGKLIAENLVENGSTLQMGIGSIPDIVLSLLQSHKDLGIHTEMFSDGLVDLFEKGAVTNSKKKLLPGVIVSSFILGTEKVFSFINRNDHLLMKDVQWTNLPENIAQNPKVVAINSCIEIDLTGTVASDSIGQKIYSGFGGQVDFIKGAALGTDGFGRPILAITSMTNKGKSKITAQLTHGAGVVTPADHVHYVVTEYGIAQLFGRNLRQRAYSLIQIAHPNFREELEKAAFEQLKVIPSPE